ncbi:2-hydroxychromene-2-carboxylate isomerase [Denitrobaculum tricleocarpae]|uniref:2-hydroxychromene-2-carboxylate isomerase n=1 Tax=Denitrobaculum tricleocarpae TaxID=2591009 RepID=A0A545TL66_9PROT|nr:2-hydroxychromene-2-carboxylate isomerase [Denitrobaculum tricleocarpae]TQV77965.1 2-hydroxychromene-2-carboxylate isomerase [Denitrobaculum tricleocarpae]
MIETKTTDVIEFHFDFASPFGYFAAQEIDGLAARHGRSAVWRPVLLGAVFKETGARPLTEIPMKAGYARHDIQRTARRMGIPFQMPSPFPFATIAACRAFYWLDALDPEAAKTLAKALYDEAFGKGGDISSAQSVVQVAAGLGHDAGQVEAALKDPEVKERLRAVVQSAIEREIFGSPFFIVDDEPFWGHDRMAMLEDWLQNGGW